MTYSVETFDALVALTRSIRPRWDTPGVKSAIRQALAREEQPSLAELAYAVIRVAENFAVETPAVIAMDGPHWRNPIRELTPPSAVDCAKCRRTHMPSFDCQAEHITPRQERKALRIEELREAYLAAKAETCPHGVLPHLCPEHKNQPAEEAADA